MAQDVFQANCCAERLKAFSDPHRLRIVAALRYGELTVSDIAQLLDAEMVTNSHHLKMMKHARLAEVRREGRFKYYRLHADLLRTKGSSTAKVAMDDLLVDLTGKLHARLVATASEAAHLNVIGLCDQSCAVANVVSNATGPELSLASSTLTRQANLVVNAQVAIIPADLETIFREGLSTVSLSGKQNHDVLSLRSFRPGCPVPTP